MKKTNSNTKTKTIEKEKVVAETINGRFAMLGLMAAIGAYLTTGQIIHGFVKKTIQKFTYKKMENSKQTYWQNAERTNGRMAMMGLFALVVNYGLFGWIIPGIF